MGLLSPSVPPGYRYIGYDVVVDGVLVESTIPLDRPERSSDLSYIQSQKVAQDGSVTQDCIVRCLYERKTDWEEPPPLYVQQAIPPEWLKPPATPPGYVYIGREVVVNGVYAVASISLGLNAERDGNEPGLTTVVVVEMPVQHRPGPTWPSSAYTPDKESSQ